MAGITDSPVEDVVLRIMDGNEAHILTSHTTHEGEGAVLLTFYYKSKSQQYRLIVRGSQVWEAGGRRPGILKGVVLRSNGVQVPILKTLHLQPETAMAAG